MHTCTGTHTCELCVGWLLEIIQSNIWGAYWNSYTHTHTHSCRHAHTCFQGSDPGLAFSSPPLRGKQTTLPLSPSTKLQPIFSLPESFLRLLPPHTFSLLSPLSILYTPLHSCQQRAPWSHKSAALPWKFCSSVIPIFTSPFLAADVEPLGKFWLLSHSSQVLQSWFCCLLAVWPWGHFLDLSLSLYFLVCITE